MMSGNKTKFDGGEPEILALIAAYGEYKCIEHHPSKKKLFWMKMAEFITLKTGVVIDPSKIKCKWRKLKDSYNIAKIKMASSGESYSEFKFYREMDKIFGERPIYNNNEGITVGIVNFDANVPEPFILSESEDNVENISEIENNVENVTNIESDSLENIVPIQDERTVQQDDRAVQPLRDFSQRVNRRRRRETNMDKLLHFKREQMEEKKRQFEEILKHKKGNLKHAKEKEANKERRHRERRADLLTIFGINERHTEEYLND